MPFHVELSSPHHHARVFNIDEAELQATVLTPWVGGQKFEFGEQEWDPRESKLTILEGKALTGPDLAFGQGWSNARRSAEDVTRRFLEAAELNAPLPTALLIEADSVEAGLAALKAGEEPQPLRWADAAQRIDGRDPSVAAVILVAKRPADSP